MQRPTQNALCGQGVQKAQALLSFTRQNPSPQYMYIYIVVPDLFANRCFGDWTPFCQASCIVDYQNTYSARNLFKAIVVKSDTSKRVFNARTSCTPQPAGRARVSRDRGIIPRLYGERQIVWSPARQKIGTINGINAVFNGR